MSLFNLAKTGHRDNRLLHLRGHLRMASHNLYAILPAGGLRLKNDFFQFRLRRALRQQNGQKNPNGFRPGGCQVIVRDADGQVTDIPGCPRNGICGEDKDLICCQLYRRAVLSHTASHEDLRSLIVNLSDDRAL